MNIRNIGPRPLKNTILASLLLGAVNTTHAGIMVEITYDPSADTTRIEQTGSWETWEADSTSSIVNFVFDSISSGQALMTPGGSIEQDWGGLTLQSGQALTTASQFGAGTTTAWGFNSTTSYGPIGYVAGTTIVNDVVILPSDFYGILTNGPTSGTYAGDGKTFSYTAAVVPEPTTSAAILGLSALGVIAIRRQRG